MTKIAFLGLGRMGLPMARRLAAAGHDLTVWNRTPARTEPLAGLAKIARTRAEAVEEADLIVTMLADPAAVEAVYAGLLDSVRPGTTIVEMSSIGPAAVRELAARLPAGVTLIDAPVLGSTPAATSGDLVILAGGTPEDLDRVEPVLAVLGTVRRCGELGTGAALKLVVISSMITAVAQIAEAMELAGALGVPADAALGALTAGPLAGVVARARSTGADFPIRLAAKDLDLSIAAAGGLPLAEAARARLRAAITAGAGEADLSRLLS